MERYTQYNITISFGMWKCSVLVVVVICLCLPSVIMGGLPKDLEDLAKQLHNDCVAETGVDEAFIDMINSKQGFPDDVKLKTYLKCVLDELVVLDDDGVMDIDAFVAMMPDDISSKVNHMMRTCGTKKGDNVLDTIWLTNKCYYEVDTETYFIA